MTRITALANKSFIEIICLSKVSSTRGTSSEAPRGAVQYFSRLELGSAIIILPPQLIKGGVNSQSVSHSRAPVPAQQLLGCLELARSTRVLARKIKSHSKACNYSGIRVKVSYDTAVIT